MWKELIVYNIKSDRYLISDTGIVYDKYTCRNVPYHIYNGYYTCMLSLNDGTTKTFRVHRLVLATFSLCKMAGEDIVNHKDLNKTNNEVSNLEYTTLVGNCRHSIENHSRKLVDGYIEPMYEGTSNKAGSRNGSNSVFTEEQVRKICEMMEKNITYPEILESLGMPPNKNLLDILTKIRSKKLWYCVSKDYNIPNKEYRSPAIHYSDDQIETICKMIADGKELSEIALAFGVDISDRTQYDKFWHHINRIKTKKTYSRISDKYF